MSQPRPLRTPADVNDRLMREAGAVIHRRLEIMAEAMCDPAAADLTELALMSDEKIAAFHEVSRRTAAGAGVLAERVADLWATEAEAASHALEEVMTAPDAARAAVIQTRWALDCWTRAAERALTLNADWARMQTYALAPVHTAVSANARRLKKTRETR